MNRNTKMSVIDSRNSCLLFGSCQCWFHSVKPTDLIQPRLLDTRVLLSHQLCVTTLSNAVVTCEIKLFQPSTTSVWNNFAWNYFRGLLQLMNIFQHVHCHWNDFEI